MKWLYINFWVDLLFQPSLSLFGVVVTAYFYCLFRLFRFYFESAGRLWNKLQFHKYVGNSVLILNCNVSWSMCLILLVCKCIFNRNIDLSFPHDWWEFWHSHHAKTKNPFRLCVNLISHIWTRSKRPLQY